MKHVDTRTIAVVTSSALILLFGGIVVQHLRHGWPFSLHHQKTADRSEQQTKFSEKNHVQAHPRAALELSPAQMAAIGITLGKVGAETLSRPVRTVATVVPDESRVSHVHTRVAGWIERFYVNTTGQEVRAGQPVAGIFSQELLSSQTEYLAARQAATSSPQSGVVEGARARLKVLGMTDAEIEAIEARGEPRRLVTVTAPRSGTVLHRGISVGTAVDPSTELITIADLSRVWILAELPEADIPSVSPGTPARLEFPGANRPPFAAAVEFLYPTLSERTRSLRVRFVVDNPSGALRPGLYGTADFQVAPRRALTVPRDAVVDTGAAQHVFVVEGEHRFVPRKVVLGIRLEDRVEIREGLREGETVAASGVFLLDSESRLRASGQTGHAHGGDKEAPEHQGH
jgi:Cu(I)/Ag(I) efflux system membrane fusion protein